MDQPENCLMFLKFSKCLLITFTVLMMLWASICVTFHEIIIYPIPLTLRFFKQISIELSVISYAIASFGLIFCVTTILTFILIGINFHKPTRRESCFGEVKFFQFPFTWFSFFYKIVIPAMVMAFFGEWFRNHLLTSSRQQWEEWMMDYNKSPFPQIIEDYIETELQCCGISLGHGISFNLFHCFQKYKEPRPDCVKEVERTINQTLGKYLGVIFGVSMIFMLYLFCFYILQKILLKERKYRKNLVNAITPNQKI